MSEKVLGFKEKDAFIQDWFNGLKRYKMNSDVVFPALNTHEVIEELRYFLKSEKINLRKGEFKPDEYRQGIIKGINMAIEIIKNKSNGKWVRFRKYKGWVKMKVRKDK